MNLKPPDLSTIIEAEQKRLGKFTRPVAILLIVVGFIGLISPVFLSTLTVGIVAAILILGGIFWSVHIYGNSQRHFSDWLRPLLLLITGLIIVWEPAAGIASLGLLFILYFLLDAYRNFTAHQRSGGIGRPWFIFSGIVDVFIALLFLLTWPGGSLVLVGIFVGINLIFDGIALLLLSRFLKGGGNNQA
ncbi:HdeD family acid-resistance protein [Acidithiobacillus sp. IBUN Pt1247-S3]|uniref:HdeD family acid-resistance protein n=1 Tax=Acidithiobacillus sp. IBUN Pt1247-S3 TaxID=3166642 RepID=UPI0034E46AE5